MMMVILSFVQRPFGILTRKSDMYTLSNVYTYSLVLQLLPNIIFRLSSLPVNNKNNNNNDDDDEFDDDNNDDCYDNNRLLLKYLVMIMIDHY